jgi:hypothetical protein
MYYKKIAFGNKWMVLSGEKPEIAQRNMEIRYPKGLLLRHGMTKQEKKA